MLQNLLSIGIFVNSLRLLRTSFYLFGNGKRCQVKAGSLFPPLPSGFYVCILGMGHVFPCCVFRAENKHADGLVQHVLVFSTSICMNETYTMGSIWKAVTKIAF